MLRRLRHGRADQQREDHHGQGLEHHLAGVSGDLLERDQVIGMECGRDLADVLRAERPGRQDRRDIQPEQRPRQEAAQAAVG